MLKGRVIGEVWATRKILQLESEKMILIAEIKPDGTLSDNIIVALDSLDARKGDTVAVSFGSGARNTKTVGNNRHIAVDAAVSMIIES